METKVVNWSDQKKQLQTKLGQAATAAIAVLDLCLLAQLS